MKTKIIKGIKYDMFERDDIINKLNRSEKDWELVDKYQSTFPELLQCNTEGFCIDARQLHKNLVENVKEGKVGDRFSQWIKRRLSKYKFEENVDYITFHNFVNRENSTNLKSKTNEYTLTLDMAKQLCMIENNETGLLVRKYFITIESALKEHIDWINSRNSEKKNWNDMIECLKKWAKNKIPDFDEKNDLKFIRIREANMLNICLTGLTASELQDYKDAKDNITRDYLNKNINSALDELEIINSSLLLGNLDFESRKQIIKNTCESKFKQLYLKAN